MTGTGDRSCRRPVDLDVPFRVADSALAGIHALLVDLMDRATLPSIRRRSPREIAELQALIDRTVRDIDRIVESTTAGGQPLLTGEWFIPVGKGFPTGEAVQILPCMRSNRLGPDSAACLFGLQSGGSHSLLLISVARAIEIIGHAAARVVVARRQLANFRRRAAQGDEVSGGIAIENQSAADSAILDQDFATAVSRVSRGDALATALAAQAGGGSSAGAACSNQTFSVDP